MNKKLVLKRLSASDLTFFEHHYRNTSGTKQKAFNLDVAVFVGELYPGIPERMSLTRDRIPLDLWIYGPGTAGLHNLQRKILKQEKNWRLNGELIHSPSDDEQRYDCLKKDDYVLINFSGDVEPERAYIYLIASTLPDDTELYNALASRYSSVFNPRKGMQVVRPEEIANVINSLNLPEGHAALDLIEADALEDAVQGGLKGVQELQKRRKARGVSHQEFAHAKQRAEKNGFLGEEILNAWLSNEVVEKRISDFRWEAKQNAVSPYDFVILDNGNPIQKIDAKSTSGNFTNAIHVSISELYEMGEGGVPYKIYRLYFINERDAYLKISTDMKEVAKAILLSLAEMPEGVMADGVTITPSTLEFGEEIIISLDTLNNSE